MASGDSNPVKLSLYLDELLSNYKVEMKDEELSGVESEDYINMFISALKVENYSELTLKKYQYELRGFSKFIDKSIIKTSTADVRRFHLQ